MNDETMNDKRQMVLGFDPSKRSFVHSSTNRANSSTPVVILRGEGRSLIPADRYTWGPSPDVRTITQVFLYASAANYNLYKLVGTPTPAGVDMKTLEQSTSRKEKSSLPSRPRRNGSA